MNTYENILARDHTNVMFVTKNWPTIKLFNTTCEFTQVKNLIPVKYATNALCRNRVCNHTKFPIVKINLLSVKCAPDNLCGRDICNNTCLSIN